MQGRHHALCGAAIAAPALLYLTGGSIGAAMIGVPIATVGALLPDIDTRYFALQSEIWRGWKRIAHAARSRGLWGEPFALAAYFVGAIMAGTLGSVSWLLRRFVSHRGATHTLTCAALVGLFAVWGSLRLFDTPVPGLALVVGYVSHLVTDAMTIRGVDLFNPFIPLTVHVLPPGLRFRNGGTMEMLAVCFVILGAAFAAFTALVRFGPHL